MADVAVDKRSNAVLIVGAGLSGMQSGLLLAQRGHAVYLLDEAPGIGGSLHLLDRTFPTDSCGLCISSPTNATYCPSIECSLHPNIAPLPLAELLALDGEPGHFRARIRRNPRYVNVERCTLCGDCAAVCPATRPHPHEGDLAPQKAIYAPPPRAVPNAYVIDMAACIRCGKCVEACPTGAINLDEQPTEETLEVGAVILSPGYAPFDARRKGEFGFGVLSNVVTSIQFERMVSPPGSTRGKLVRPSDGKPPKRIAFIQCVGSRDQTVGREYCSSICCMYTAKQARAALESQADAEITVFTMDIRTFGKGYERYWDGVQQEGIRFRRAMVSKAKQHPKTGHVALNYVGEAGGPKEEEFDLVVLAVGLESPQSARELAERIGLDVNPYGFGETGEFAPVASNRSGIFVAGCYAEPKDIPDTAAEAAAAAAGAAQMLAPAPEKRPEAPTATVPPDAEPAIGVFICTCHGTVGQTVDVAALADYAASLPHVAAVGRGEDCCTEQGIASLSAWVKASGVNRLVFAGCSPRLCQAELAQALARAGLAESLLQRANIREGCAWVHRDSPAQATEKAKDVVAMATARAVHANPVKAQTAPVQEGVLVIGGGLAGMTAALALANLGHPVTLVERETTLGGQLHNIGFTAQTPNPKAQAEALAQKVTSHERITVHLGATLASFSGTGGQFQAEVQKGDGERVPVSVGAVIVATGGREAVVHEYRYGEEPRVLLQGDLSRALAGGQESLAQSAFRDVRNLVMIQCAGSRDENRPYCSRICCTQAVKNAIRLKELKPGANVFVLYRDIRTFGMHELLYRRARDLGVVFIRYELPDKPVVEPAADGLAVRVTDATLGEPVLLPADAVVLSTGIAPNPNADLAQLLGVPLDSDGFFQEQHPKMRPLNFMKPGMFLCGLAHGPHFVPETIVQAQGAAMRAAAYLSERQRRSKTTRVDVNKRLCSFCGLCVSACPYGARVLDYDERVARVLTDLCQGCGICAVTCPNKATQQYTFEHKALLAEVDAGALGL
ncbi:MAG: hypothetical protein Kow00123_06750 [Anaerolineales bacterium]